MAELRALDLRLNSLLDKDGAFWRQIAKQLWLRECDLNTKFFHKYASIRCKKNCLVKLRIHDGRWVEGEELDDLVLNYYQGIFHSPGVSNLDSFARMENRLNQHHVEILMAPWRDKEVKAALFAMSPNKSLDPDGMCPGFFQHYWDVLGSYITKFTIHCLNSCSFPTGFNDLNVVLLPKKNIPEFVNDLRPIALCHVIYKVIAKMINNRMKNFMDEIIDEA